MLPVRPGRARKLTSDDKPAPALVWDDMKADPTLVGHTPQGAAIAVTIAPRADAYAIDYTLSVTNGTPVTLPVDAA